ncbi:MAG: DUF2062 domain-containing protein [Candidatus Cloacimonadota bacterium]|nr:MAG: DUF2062 domain-containing protein [Candidatus Cloacimonadota bacterium]
MKRLWKWLRDKLIIIIRIDSTPAKIAAGVGVGAFIAMFPITGFQFLTGLLLSFIFRVNRIAVVLTTQLVCNPLTMSFLFFLDYKVGEKVLGYDSSVTLDALKLLIRQSNFGNFFAVLASVAKPLYLGAAIMAPCIGIAAFALSYFLIKTFKRRI